MEVGPHKRGHWVCRFSGFGHFWDRFFGFALKIFDFSDLVSTAVFRRFPPPGFPLFDIPFSVFFNKKRFFGFYYSLVYFLGLIGMDHYSRRFFGFEQFLFRFFGFDGNFGQFSRF